MSRKIDLSGTVVGQLSVIDRAKDSKDGRPRYNCLCTCGRKKIVSARNLQRKATWHCGCIKRTTKIKNPDASLNKLIWTYKGNAIKRGLKFELTKEETRVLFSGNCHYCGCAPYKEFIHKKCPPGLIYNGIDRLDSTLGYTTKNSVSCCYVCNRMKVNYSESDFISIVLKIANNLRSKGMAHLEEQRTASSMQRK